MTGTEPIVLNQADGLCHRDGTETTARGKETLANLEGNPETAMLLQQAITAPQEPTAKTETPPPSGTTPGPPVIPLGEEPTLSTDAKRVSEVRKLSADNTADNTAGGCYPFPG